MLAAVVQEMISGDVLEADMVVGNCNEDFLEVCAVNNFTIMNT